jgi:hypothetical protein
MFKYLQKYKITCANMLPHTSASYSKYRLDKWAFFTFGFLPSFSISWLYFVGTSVVLLPNLSS